MTAILYKYTKEKGLITLRVNPRKVSSLLKAGCFRSKVKAEEAIAKIKETEKAETEKAKIVKPKTFSHKIGSK